MKLKNLPKLTELAAFKESVFDTSSEEKVLSSASDKSPLKVIPFDELNPPIENPLSLVEDVLGPGGLSIVYGPPGAGKSFLSTYLSFCIATGRSFFGKKTTQVAVLYFAAESPSSIEQRFYAYKKAEEMDYD